MHNSIAAVVHIILFIYVNNKQKAKKSFITFNVRSFCLHENFVRLNDGSRLNARIPNEYNVAIYGTRWLFFYGCLHYN